jgi:hypothetical protein
MFQSCGGERQPLGVAFRRDPRHMARLPGLSCAVHRGDKPDRKETKVSTTAPLPCPGGGVAVSGGYLADP